MDKLSTAEESDKSLKNIKSEIRKSIAIKLTPLASQIEIPHKPHEGRKKNDIRLWIKKELYKDEVVGDPKFTRNILNKEIEELKLENKIPKDFEFVRIAGKNDEASGSGRYLTFIYTFKHKDKDVEFLIVNGIKPGRTVRLKEFSPNKMLSLEIINNPYNKAEDIYEDIKNQLIKRRRKISIPERRFIEYLIELVKNYSPSIELSKITGIKIVFVGEFKDPVNNLDDYDKEEILKDFGEILVGLILGENAYLIGFPPEANARIIDLYVKKLKDKINTRIDVSVKLKAGAAPSIRGIYERINDLEKQVPGILKNFRATEIFKIIYEYHTISYPLKLASYLASLSNSNFSKTWSYFKNFIEEHADEKKLSKIDLDSPSKNGKGIKFLRVALDSVIGNLEKKYDDSKITEIIEDFRKRIKAMGKLEPYTRKRGSKHGQLVFPLQSAIVKKLNKDKDLIESIRVMLTNLSIKQFHLYRKSDGISMKIVSYGATSFSFQTGGSAPDPGVSKMRFKLSMK